jgi:hypothetical protein
MPTHRAKALPIASERRRSQSVWFVAVAATAGLLLAGCGDAGDPAEADQDTSAAAPSTEAGTQEYVESTYMPFAGKLQNPDRGFYASEWLISSTVGGVSGQPDYAFLRQRGYTLVRSLVRLDDFRDRPICQHAPQRREGATEFQVRLSAHVRRFEPAAQRAVVDRLAAPGSLGPCVLAQLRRHRVDEPGFHRIGAHHDTSRQLRQRAHRAGAL